MVCLLASTITFSFHSDIHLPSTAPHPPPPLFRSPAPAARHLSIFLPRHRFTSSPVHYQAPNYLLPQYRIPFVRCSQHRPPIFCFTIYRHANFIFSSPVHPHHAHLLYLPHPAPTLYIFTLSLSFFPFASFISFLFPHFSLTAKLVYFYFLPSSPPFVPFPFPTSFSSHTSR